MPNFPEWFKREYRQWCQSQPGGEDFLAFCSHVGYSPDTILAWIKGESIPQGGEVLNLAWLFGIEVYQALGLDEPDPELMKVYQSLSKLVGELRGKAANALWEADGEIKRREIPPESDQAKVILLNVFNKFGFSISEV